MLIFIWYVTSTRCCSSPVYSRARGLCSPETIRCSSLFHPCPPPRPEPPFSIPHNERSRNAGGQCSRKADSGIAVWPGTVHRSPSPLHLLHPRERTSPPMCSSLSLSLLFLLLPPLSSCPPPSLLAPCASGRALPVGCASIRDLTLLRRQFARCGATRRGGERRGRTPGVTRPTPRCR